jgi:photosystem II stability/assembly factor-like uncharacterized protein
VPDPASQPISVSFLPGGRTLAIGDARSGLYRWTAGAGQPTRLVTWTCGTGVSCENSLAVSPDGKSVVVTGQGAAMRRQYGLGQHVPGTGSAVRGRAPGVRPHG